MRVRKERKSLLHPVPNNFLSSTSCYTLKSGHLDRRFCLVIEKKKRNNRNEEHFIYSDFYKISTKMTSFPIFLSFFSCKKNLRRKEEKERKERDSEREREKSKED